MAKINAAPCPACESRTTLTERGFHVCDKHGVIPYGYAVGELTREKALDMMASWGVIIKRKPKREDTPRPDAPVLSGGVQALIEQLRAATGKADKRRIRAALRKLGHTGGAR